MNPNDPRSGQQPQYGMNNAPQQARNGQYEVVPPPNVSGRPSGHNPYEFIVAPNSPKKKLPIGGPSSFVGKLALFVGGFVILFIILGVVVSSFLGRNDAKVELTAVVQAQQEVIRVAALSSPADKQKLKDAAKNIELSTMSDQQKLVKFLAARDVKLDDKTIGMKKDAKADNLLTTAKSTNTYDATFSDILSDDLVAYQRALEAAFKKATTPTLKSDLQGYYNHSFLLVDQLEASQN